MQIDRIYYPVETLGFGKRIGIWTIGCEHHCYNCSNPELWGEDISKDLPVSKIIECITKIPDADGITITGGDPFYQPDELYNLIIGLSNLDYKDILVYTGYTLSDLKKKGILYTKTLEKIGVLVDGRYIDELNDNISFRGSCNQRINVLNKMLEDRYFEADKWERKTQIVMYDNKIQAIGLPLK